MRQVAVLRQLEKWRWQYILHQKGTYLIQTDEGQPWRKFQAVIEKPRQWVWLGQQQLTEEHANPVNRLAYWQIGEEQPWFLATDLPLRRPRCAPIGGAWGPRRPLAI
jgi:hypothetical protein